jgi:hypothetical protein
VLYFRVADVGTVTGLRVEGNRAAVGFVHYQELDLASGSIPRTIFIEDNGPSGDRIQFGSLASPYTTCPDPTTATFPDFFVGGFPVPPVLTSGNFVVQDHTDG